MSELESLLGDLSAEGTHESEGKFTLDLEKAEEKLGQYRLPSPHHYILALVASATAAGARSIRVQRETSEITVSFDGQAFGFEETGGLFRSLIAGSSCSETRLRSLATAVQAARSLSLVSLAVESWGGSGGVRVYLHGEMMSVQNLEESPWAHDPSRTGTVCHICESPSILSQLSNVVMGVEVGRAEFSLLRRHVRYALPAVFANGIALNTEHVGPWQLAARFGMDYPSVRPLKVRSQRCLDFGGDGKWGGYIGFGDGVGAWLIIIDGISYQMAADESNYPTSIVVAYADGISKDLSSTGLVQNDFYDEVVSSIRGALDRLVNEVAATNPPDLVEILHPLKQIAQRRSAS